VRSPDPSALAEMFVAARVPFTPAADGALVVETSGGVDAEGVARLALERRVLITELRSSDAGGLEELFFTLTHPGADTSEAVA
jgi:hypothetical protein